MRPALWVVYLCARASGVRALSQPRANNAARTTAQTPPAEVVQRQLEAFRANDVRSAYALFSRARRRFFEEEGRAQSSRPPDETLDAIVADYLTAGCPGLLGHARAEIVSAVGVRGAGVRFF